MSTSDLMKRTEFATTSPKPNHLRRNLQRLGWGILTLTLIVFSLLSTIPVALLFVTTAVPVIFAIVLVALDMGILAAFFYLERTFSTHIGTTIALILVSVLAVYLSQVHASTPPITKPNSIATLEIVDLNGSEQWITIRGQDVNNPVLLFLAGGPGGSELVMTRKYLGGLEEHFTIVNWDQPGTGKSYLAADFGTISPEKYVSDAYELTQYLRQRFHQDKIYVFGESWGSILGIWLVQDYPELYHAFISTGQMVDVVENDTEMYEFAIQLLTEQGRTEDVEQMRRIGPPPYPAETLLNSFGASNNVLNSYMDTHAHGEGIGHNLLLDSLGAQEYGLLDKVHWLLGLAQTFTTVYPQVYDVDFRTQATQLNVPVYFIKGRWDVNASNALLEEYFDILDAPHKELIWFEDSAHTPMWDEPDHFIDVMVNTILTETSPPKRDTTTFSGYFDTQMPKYLREFNIAGAVVSVVQNNAVIHLAGYGYADLDEHISMDPNQSVVHIGSAGKTFTATAIMQLVEQGKIDLNADVNTYLDFEIPDTYPEPITIWHLLTHTSGLEEHNFGLFRADPTQLPTVREYLVRNLPTRLHPPGERVGYSNYGLTLLGYVVERVSGMTLSEYLQTNVIARLRMIHSSADQTETPQNIAIGYNNRQAQPVEYIAAFGAGPIRSTAADMARYMMAHINEGQLDGVQILESSTSQAMQKRQFVAHPVVNGTGLGFYEFSRNGQTIYGHLGTTNYFHTLLLLFPEHKLGIFVSFNSAEGAQVLRSPQFMNDFMNHFFLETVTAINPPDDVAQRADDYAGTYFLNNRFGHTTLEKVAFLMDAVTIRPTQDNRLHMAMAGRGTTFTEVESDIFVQSDGHDVLVFHRDETGRVASASLKSRAVFTLERQSWYDEPLLTFTILGITCLIFVVTLLFNFYQLWLTRGQPIASMITVSHWVAISVSLLNLAFIVSLIVILPGLLRGAFPETTLHLMLSFPVIALVLITILSGITIFIWLQQDFSLLVKLEHTLLVVAGILFAITLNMWNLLGWHI